MGTPTKRSTTAKIVIASLLLVVWAGVLVWLRDNTWLAFWSAVGAGVALIVKEAVAAFAKSEEFSPEAKGRLESIAALASLVSTMLGVPAVALLLFAQIPS